MEISVVCGTCNEEITTVGNAIDSGGLIIKINPYCACTRKANRLRDMICNMAKEDPELRELIYDTRPTS